VDSLKRRTLFVGLDVDVMFEDLRSRLKPGKRFFPFYKLSGMASGRSTFAY
jgi:hypothetical protein